MILDKLNQLSEDQAPTQGTSTVSTNSFDAGDHTPKRLLGDGNPVCILFIVKSITASADAYTFEAIGATDGALTTGVAAVASSGVLTAAEIAARGNRVVVDIPPGTIDLRYYGARYTLGASDALTVDAYILPRQDVESRRDYAVGYEIQ